MYSSILVGTDGSQTAKLAVSYALGLAKEMGARLDLVSASGTPADDMPPDELEGLLATAADQARAAGVKEVETFARAGEAADAIIAIAEERGTDLIIVGNKGMTSARRFLLGAVPDKVSHHAPCSVLIVRTT